MRIVWQLCWTGTVLAAGLGLVCSTVTSGTAGVEPQVTQDLTGDEAKWEGYWERSAREKPAFWQARLLEYAGAHAATLSLDQLIVILDAVVTVQPGWFASARPGEVPTDVDAEVSDLVDQLLMVFDESEVRTLILIPEAYRRASEPPASEGPCKGTDCNCFPLTLFEDCGRCVNGLDSFCDINYGCCPVPGCGALGIYTCTGICRYAGACSRGTPG